MPPAATDSLSASVAPIAAGAHVTAACFLGDTPALALGDGTVLLGAEGERRVAAHPDGAVLCATADRVSSSRPCRRTPCMAGASPIRSTCG